MKKQFIPLVIILVIAMCIISEYIGEKEIIFPEISALAIGAWIMKAPAFGCNNLHLWISPTIAAITGLVIITFFPYYPFFMVIAAFILIALQLRIMGSKVTPSFSAAILPILIHTQSWYYPLSVCILTGIIAFGKELIDIFHKNTSIGFLNSLKQREKVDFTREELINWIKILTSITLISACSLYFHWNYIIAPPLIVTFVELAKPKGKLYFKTVFVFISMALAALLGGSCLYFIYYLLHLSVWVAAGLSMVCVFLVFHLLRFTLPPVAAIALLPIIIPAKNLFMYPVQILIGSSIFLLINLFWIKKLPISKIFLVLKLSKTP